MIKKHDEEATEQENALDVDDPLLVSELVLPAQAYVLPWPAGAVMEVRHLQHDIHPVGGRALDPVYPGQASGDGGVGAGADCARAIRHAPVDVQGEGRADSGGPYGEVRTRPVEKDDEAIGRVARARRRPAVYRKALPCSGQDGVVRVLRLPLAGEASRVMKLVPVEFPLARKRHRAPAVEIPSPQVEHAADRAGIPVRARKPATARGSQREEDDERV
ncbi:MAG: hypothetical protein AB2L13_04110 [Spirochaetota bacterium]